MRTNTCRQAHGQTGRQAYGQTGRQAHGQTGTWTDRQIDTHNTPHTTHHTHKTKGTSAKKENKRVRLANSNVISKQTNRVQEAIWKMRAEPQKTCKHSA